MHQHYEGDGKDEPNLTGLARAVFEHLNRNGNPMKTADQALTSVITGDLINSRQLATSAWLQHLKATLTLLGEESHHWQVYRGDSFQLEIPLATDALEAAIFIKASIKTLKGLDVRMAIGLGEKAYGAEKVTESNGEAFINSGETFENLYKQKTNLAIKSPWPDFDEDINIMLRLALTFMDRWLVSYAEVIAYSLRFTELSQTALGAKLNIAQNTVSNRQSRAHKDELLALIHLYKKKLSVIEY